VLPPEAPVLLLPEQAPKTIASETPIRTQHRC
jgi:hypothetical protein